MAAARRLWVCPQILSVVESLMLEVHMGVPESVVRAAAKLVPVTAEE